MFLSVVEPHLASDLDGAFEDFVRRHQDSVFTVALRMTGHRQDAEDIAQETFVRAYRSLSSYSSARRRALKERAWIVTITLNLCRNRARQLGRRPVSTPLGDDPEDRVGGPDEAGGDDWWAGLVAGLPVLYRAPLVLRHVEGMSYEEVAAALTRPVGTVKAQVHRAVGLLRETAKGERGWTTTV